MAALGALRRHADDATTFRHASAHHRKHALGAAIARWRLIMKLRFAAVAVAAAREDAAGAASAVASLRSGFFPWRLLSEIRGRLTHLRRASAHPRNAPRRRHMGRLARSTASAAARAERCRSSVRRGTLAVVAPADGATSGGGAARPQQRAAHEHGAAAVADGMLRCLPRSDARRARSGTVAATRRRSGDEQLAAARAVHRRTRTALSRHLTLDVRRAVAHWAGPARRYTGLRRSATRVALAGGVRSLHDALNAWLTAAAARRRAIFVAGRGAAALRQRGERSGFSALLEASVVHRRALLQLSRSAAALVHNLLRAAMNSWLEGTIARLHATSTLGRAVAALRQRGLRRALNSWLEAARRHWTRMGLYQAAAPLAARATRRAFRRWEVAPLLQLCFSAVAAVSRHETRRAMNAWLAAAASRAATLSLLRRAVAAMHHRTALAALNSWADAAADRRAAQQLASEGKAAFRRHGLRAALGAWLLTAARRAILTSKARRVVAAVMAREERAALHIWATRTFKRRVSLGQLDGRRRRSCTAAVAQRGIAGRRRARDGRRFGR